MTHEPTPDAQASDSTNDPEPIGPIAEEIRDGLADRRAEAIARLRRQTPAIRRSHP